jgi:hypothetical protein
VHDVSRRILLGGALGLLLAGALVGCVELLAHQAPGSPLYLGVLPGPIGVLRELTLWLGLLLLGADALAARVRVPLGLTRALLSAAALAVLAQAYGAAHGMYGLQVKDLRADALPLLLIKHVALVAFTAGYGWLGWRAVRAQPLPPPTIQMKTETRKRPRRSGIERCVLQFVKYIVVRAKSAMVTANSARRMSNT